MKTTTKNQKTIIELSIILAFVLGIIVCAICDLAITKNFSWSLYPIASIVFAFLTIAPFFHLDLKRGTALSLLSFSMFLIPFLFCLERITEIEWFFSLGLSNAVILIAFLWTVYGVFAIKKLRWWYSSAISLLLAIPFCFAVNFALSKVITEPMFDVWDILSFGIIAVVSLGLFCAGYFAKRNTVS